MSEIALDVKEKNFDAAEKWCRKVAFLITQPGVENAPTKLQADILSKIPDNNLRYLAVYFKKCENWKFNGKLVGFDRTELLKIVEELASKVRDKEVSIKLPYEMKNFIPPSMMGSLIGKVKGMNKVEVRVKIAEHAEELMNSGTIILKSSRGVERIFPEADFHPDAFQAKELIILVHSGSKLVPMMAPNLEDYFVEFFQKKSLLPADKKDWVAVSTMLKMLRSGGMSDLAGEIKKLRDFVSELADNNSNIATHEEEMIPALSHISTHARGTRHIETTMLSPQMQEYIRFNFYESKNALPNADKFLAPSKACTKLKLENTTENRTIIELLQQEQRHERKFEVVDIQIEGEQRVGDLTRRLVSKSARKPMFFVHEAALEEPFLSSEQAIVTKQMVVEKRKELRESKTNPADLLEMTTAKGR